MRLPAIALAGIVIAAPVQNAHASVIFPPTCQELARQLDDARAVVIARVGPYETRVGKNPTLAEARDCLRAEAPASALGYIKAPRNRRPKMGEALSLELSTGQCESLGFIGTPFPKSGERVAVWLWTPEGRDIEYQRVQMLADLERQMQKCRL